VKSTIDNKLWKFANTGAEESMEIESPLFEEKVISLKYDEQKIKQFHQRAQQYLHINCDNEDLIKHHV
tara:strand:- start:436 stop:639 length:204 start_codon:yes stop_codon:yes gene_type:complete